MFNGVGKFIGVRGLFGEAADEAGIIAVIPSGGDVDKRLDPAFGGDGVMCEEDLIVVVVGGERGRETFPVVEESRNPIGIPGPPAEFGREAPRTMMAFFGPALVDEVFVQIVTPFGVIALCITKGANWKVNNDVAIIVPGRPGVKVFEAGCGDVIRDQHRVTRVKLSEVVLIGVRVVSGTLSVMAL